MQLDYSLPKKRKQAGKGKGTALHRCRFVDWRPSPISCLALSPDTFDCAGIDVKADRGLLAVGRLDGDIDVMRWGGHQGWIRYRTLPCPFAQDSTSHTSTKRPFSMISHVAWSHQTTLSESDLSLFEGDRTGVERELARLRRQSLRLFAVGGHNRELVEYEWGAPGGSSHFGQVKAVLPSLPPILSLAVSPSGAYLAVGCEDSAVRIVSLLDNEFDVIAKIEVGSAAKVRPTSIAFAPCLPPPSQSAVTSEASTSRGEPASRGSERAQLTESQAASLEPSSLPDTFATPRESAIVVGCSDSTIRRFDAPRDGSLSAPWRQSHRMTVDRLKGEHTVVWAVVFAADMTIVSGDSMGNVKFWDYRMGTQLHTYKAHRADVLTIAVGSSGRNLFTSGVDQKVVEFKLVQVKKAAGETTTSRWVEASGRRIHAHDVQAMVISPPFSASPRLGMTPVLTSGGFDLGLAMVCAATTQFPPGSTKPYPNVVSDVPSTAFETTVHRKASYAPQKPTVQLAPKARLVMCRRARSVGIWRVGKSATSSNDSSDPSHVSANGFVDDALAEDWTKLLDIELKLQTNLVASAISVDGTWLAVSDLFETKLFKLSTKAGELHAKRIRDFSSSLSLALPGSFGTGSSCLEFTPDTSKLVLSTAFGSTVAIVALPAGKEGACTVEATFDARSSASRPVKKVPNGAATNYSDDDDSDEDMEDSIVSAELEEPTSVSTLAVSADGHWLACATLRRRVAIYDLATARLHTVLPTCKSPPTALAFASVDDDETWLISAFADNSLDVFSLDGLRSPDWASQLSSTALNRLMDYREPIVGLVVRAKTVDSVRSIVVEPWAANWIAKVDLTALRDSDLAKKVVHRGQRKSSKRRRASLGDADADDGSGTVEALDIPVNRRYSPILLFDHISNGSKKGEEAVVVERVWQDVVHDLPPAFARFGEFGS